MSLPKLSFSGAIEKALPELRMGLLVANIRVAVRSEALNAVIEATCAQLAEQESTESIRQHPVIAATREAYKRLGKDPSRYRPSAEALMKRAVQGKGLYQISNAVDALNLISMRTGFSIGGYDADALEGELLLDRGTADEPYEAIGRGTMNMDGLPVLRDARSAFGSPTSDSMRSRVQDHSTRFLLLFYDMDGKGPLSLALDRTQSLLAEHADATDFARLIVSVT